MVELPAGRARIQGSPETPAGSPPPTATLLVGSSPIVAGVCGGERSARRMNEVLSALGYGAACTSVAETMICAYLRWGTGFVRHLQDDALISMWDGRSGTLHLIRGGEADGAVGFATAGSAVCFHAGAGVDGCPLRPGGVPGPCLRADAPIAGGSETVRRGRIVTFGAGGARLATERDLPSRV